MLLCFAAALLSLPTLSRADGFIIIRDPGSTARVPGHFDFAPLSVTYHRVTVEINDQVATTSVDQEFYNPNARQLEGTYLFPLPEGSHIDKFSMDIDGKQVEAELLNADNARSIYEDIVRRTRDPALLVQCNLQGRSRILGTNDHASALVETHGKHGTIGAPTSAPNRCPQPLSLTPDPFPRYQTRVQDQRPGPSDPARVEQLQALCTEHRV
jgi:hypothetical protein